MPPRRPEDVPQPEQLRARRSATAGAAPASGWRDVARRVASWVFLGAGLLFALTLLTVVPAAIEGNDPDNTWTTAVTLVVMAGATIFWGLKLRRRPEGS